MKFINPYHWLYAKCYLLVGSQVNPHFTTIVLMNSMLLWNFMAITCLIDIFFHIRVPKIILGFSVEIVFGLYFLWLVTTMIYFLYKGRSKKILLDFNVEKKLKESWCGLPGLMYVVFSLLVPFCLIPLKTKYGLH